MSFLLTANIVLCSCSHLFAVCYVCVWLSNCCASCLYVHTWAWLKVIRQQKDKYLFRLFSHAAHRLSLLFIHSCFQSWPTQTSYYHTWTPPTSPATATTISSPSSRTTSLSPPPHKPLLHLNGSGDAFDCPSTDTSPTSCRHFKRLPMLTHAHTHTHTHTHTYTHTQSLNR